MRSTFLQFDSTHTVSPNLTLGFAFFLLSLLSRKKPTPLGGLERGHGTTATLSLPLSRLNLLNTAYYLCQTNWSATQIYTTT
jgi:hypothetical protein